MSIRTLINRILDAMPVIGDRRRDKAEAATREYFYNLGAQAATRRLNSEPGWTRWVRTPPPMFEVVEVMSGLTGNSYELLPADMDPMCNVYHLYWRPVGGMRLVGGERTTHRYLH